MPYNNVATHKRDSVYFKPFKPCRRCQRRRSRRRWSCRRERDWPENWRKRNSNWRRPPPTSRPASLSVPPHSLCVVPHWHQREPTCSCLNCTVFRKDTASCSRVCNDRPCTMTVHSARTSRKRQLRSPKIRC